MERPLIDPVNRFNGDWFTRNEQKLDPTDAERAMIRASFGETRSRWATNPNIAKMAEVLRDDPDVLDRIGQRLLNTIIGTVGGGPAITFLLKHGVPFDMPLDVYNQMHEAAWANAQDSLAALFEAGVVDATIIAREKPHTGWPSNITLMFWPAHQGRVELAKTLIKYGVGKHYEEEMVGNGERGATVLQETSAPPRLGSVEDHHEIARLLIKDGAYYDIGSACGLNDIERVKVLLEEDPNRVGAKLQYDMTPLHWAARADADEIVKLLLECNGIDVDALTGSHRTPLQLAAETNAANSITLLGEAGADLNTQDKKGRTPLHRATYEGKVAATEALLAQGADPTITNKNGKTAFQIARKEARFFKKEPI